MKAVISVFGFNRPEKLESLLGSLLRSDGISSIPVHIFIDGPRDESDVENVDKSCHVARRCLRPNWNLTQSDVNIGCRGSIPKGVTSLSEYYESIIVLEDDMILSKAAINYFLAGLSRFSDHERAWSICGYGFRSDILANYNRSFFLPHFHPWGWATWSKKWKTFSLDQEPISEKIMALRHFRDSFNAFGLSNSTDLLDLEQRRLVDCWDVRWHRHIFDNGGLCLYPSRNYIANTGFDAGTHGSRINPTRLLLGRKHALNEELPSWPEEVIPDFPALDLMTNGREAKVQRFIAKGGRLKRLVFSGAKRQA